LRNNDNDVTNKQPQRLVRFVSEAGQVGGIVVQERIKIALTQLMASLLNPNFRKAPMLASSALNNSNLEFSNHFSSLSLNSLFKGKQEFKNNTRNLVTFTENRLCAVAFGVITH